MRLLSWNVCGLAAAGRKGALAALLDLAPAVDVFAFQETRCDDAKAMALLAPMVARGYAHVALHASRVKAGHAGVAIVSRLPFKRLPDMPGDDQGRVLTVDLGGVTLVAAYVQNAGVKALERLPDRIAWDARFLAHVAAQGQPTVVCGDLNVARDELDVHHPERQGRHAGFTPQERAGFEALLAATGLVDTFRRARPGEAKYSYWSNFARSREKGLGWRIDYFLAPADLPCGDPDILDGVLGSDHAPVVLTVAVAAMADRKADLVAALAALKARA